MPNTPTDTIAAIATPPGSGALAIVRAGGGGAAAVARAVLGKALPPRRAVLARARDSAGDIDQVVSLFFPAESSPTGEDLVEITCHGSPYIQKRLLKALLEAGARAAEPGEFTRRSFCNGRMDLAQAEAVCDLIAAGTGAAHRSALSQLEGGLSRDVDALRAPILGLLTHLEACLDHPEEDIPPLGPAEAKARLTGLEAPVARLADSFRTGRLLREGPRVCIVGRPNAGKSSLLNALLGCERAIVCPEPGTTRDTIEEPCDLDGTPAVLVDTAGLGHDCACAADAESLRRTQRALRSSDVAVLVIDGSRPPDARDEAAHRALREASAEDRRPVLTVLSKADLAPRAPAAAGGCRVSVLRGDGMAELRSLLARTLGGGAGAACAGGAAVTCARHHDALRRCLARLGEARACVDSRPGCWEELAARELREALAALDEITGPAAPDEVLAGIFSRFCVGK
ncbi:MAG: tRNA modification GTPase [Elusimicrobia bacterium]|nr:tRNA modification GTPase [Elusimicrobiota bacterium]